MYKLKDGITWENVKTAIEFVDITNPDKKFNDYFEKIELPKIELKRSESMLENPHIYIININIKPYNMISCKRNNVELRARIGIDYDFKSIEDFNEKASSIFGFELIEAKEDILK